VLNPVNRKETAVSVLNSTKLILTLLLSVLFFSFLSGSVSASSTSAQAFSSSTPSYDYGILSAKHTVTGTQSALVVLVEFSDVRHTKSPDQMRTVALEQLNTYYKEVSYGKISITGQVYGWYTVDHPIGFYGRDSKEPGDDDNLRQLAQDAVALLPSSVDPAPFRFLVIVHAGQDQADDKYDVKSDEIWSRCRCSTFPDYEPVTPVYRGSKAFANFMFLSEFDGMGTFAHEAGHLFGLPDFYDYDTYDSYVGFWSLMDDGSRCCYNEAASTPSYVGAWGAALLGWLTPSVAEPKVLVSSFDLKPLESPQASAILVPVFPSTYYFIEYRTKVGADSYLPWSGVLVYYVNERLQSGQGILRLVDPETQDLFPSQEHARDLDNAAFKLSDRFRDTAHQVYLAFLGGANMITTVYSTQELMGSIIGTSLTVPQMSFNGMYSDRLTLTGTLLDQGGIPMGGQTVEVDVLQSSGEWEKIDSASSDQLGGLSFQLNLDYALGHHSFRLFYSGGKSGAVWYTSSSAEFSVNIEAAKMTLTMPQLGVVVDESSIVISATGLHGEPLQGVLVAVYVNEIQQAVGRTDENGKATLLIQFSPGDIGPRTITVKADAVNYLSTQNSGGIFVMPLWLIALTIALVAAFGIVAWRSSRRRRRTDPPG